MEQIKIEKLHPEILPKFNSPLSKLISILNNYREKPFETYLDLANEIRPIFIQSIAEHLNPKTKGEIEHTKEIIYTLCNDPILMESAITLSAIKNPNYYVIQKDFLSKFLKTKLDSVRFSDLPKHLTGYIKLPIPIQDSDGDQFNHVYFFVGQDKDFFQIKNWRYGTENAKANTKTETALWSALECRSSLEKSDRLIQIVLVQDPDPEFASITSEKAVRTFGIRFPKDDTIAIQDLLSGKLESDYNNNNSQVKLGYPDYLRIVINLILYINTGDPDIRDFQNKIKIPGEKKPKPIRHSDSLSNLQVKLVGYNWKKNIIKTYSLSSWQRSGHFRWQRHGKGLSLVKLIWIDDQTLQRRKESIDA